MNIRRRSVYRSRKKAFYYDGYMTMEATFVVPLAVMVIVLLLYWGFFCYDKSVSIQCSYLAALRISNEWELSQTEAEERTREELDKLSQEKVLFMKNESMSVDVGLSGIRTSLNGRMDILFSEWRQDNMTHWLINSEKKALRLKPTAYIRRYHLVGEAIR